MQFLRHFAALLALACVTCVMADDGDGSGLALSRPVLPEPVAGRTHPVDRLIDAYFAEQQIARPAEVVDDRTFARRVSLDLIGRLPDPAAVEALIASDAADRRQRFVEAILDDDWAYGEHWMTFWSDHLRNAYRGTGFIDNGRKQITGWLFASLYENKPYDRFVHELISPVPGSEGFTLGIKWRGVVNESQRKEIQAAQNVAQVFLGTNLKCASCHDSFVNDWTLDEAYALSSVFADEPLEIHHCDKPTGETSEVGFIYPELGTIDADHPRERRMRQLADLIVQRKNGRFARTIVNRLWARLMGRGLVEPLDNMDEPAWNRDLLDWLARDFVEHDYDLRHTLAVIATSQAYQLPADQAPAPGRSDEYVFRGPRVKRMTAEQFVDAVHAVARLESHPDPAGFKKDGRGQGGQLAEIVEFTAAAAESRPNPTAAQLAAVLRDAHWIWNDANAMQAAGNAKAHFRRVFELDAAADHAVVAISADNEFELFVNGQPVAKGQDWSRPGVIHVGPHLRAGTNVIAVTARNGGTDPNPAGLIAVLMTAGDDGKYSSRIITDESWHIVRKPQPGWTTETKDPTGTAALLVAPGNGGPWNIASRVGNSDVVTQSDAAVLWGDRHVVAALQPRDTLQAALGRPNREQVVTRRESKGTLLQALELTNGKTLDSLLREGGRKWIDASAGTDSLVSDLYREALGRHATAAERHVASDLVGDPPSAEGVADLLWVLVLLPEFQLIY
ncbi:hypothetical protein Mal4_28010 [Maioricimonas rarisocia]|uniref:DUF1549 domain-containing protein n=1 Tax=Maioricimonas rarisocia TaxID=2528026 RepID=A0A517Z7L4_9PLAN|nr:DUF1549 domain-containing protein [Maioricimonas rarisocia]QDU38473.1 hypothetical protein Mal4_28010 [Maioricimonas rarisocia]